jgi:hypothetical protein
MVAGPRRPGWARIRSPTRCSATVGPTRRGRGRPPDSLNMPLPRIRRLGRQPPTEAIDVKDRFVVVFAISSATGEKQVSAHGWPPKRYGNPDCLLPATRPAYVPLCARPSALPHAIEPSDGRPPVSWILQIEHPRVPSSVPLGVLLDRQGKASTSTCARGPNGDEHEHGRRCNHDDRHQKPIHLPTIRAPTSWATRGAPRGPWQARRSRLAVSTRARVKPVPVIRVLPIPQLIAAHWMTSRLKSWTSSPQGSGASRVEGRTTATLRGADRSRWGQR